MKGKGCCTENWNNFGLLALRVIVGGFLLYHGWMKLSDMAATVAGFTEMGLPAAALLAWGAALLETVGGAMLVLGIWAKFVALILGVEMLVALLFVHTGMPFATSEIPFLMLAGLLGIKASGGGKWRLTKDECLCGKK